MPLLVLLPLAPWVAETIGFWVVFVIGAWPVLDLLPAMALTRALHARHLTGEHKEEQLSGGRRATSYLRLVPPILLLLGVTLAGGALITFTPQLASAPVLTVAGLLVFTATAALSRWRFGGLADRYGAQQFVWPLVALTVVGLTMVAWAVRDPTATAAAALLVGLAVVGVCYGGLQNLTLVMTFQRVARRDYGMASAAWNVGFDAGTGLGAVLVGLVAAGSSFPVALLCAAGFSLSTLPLALRPVVLRRRGEGSGS